MTSHQVAGPRAAGRAAPDARRGFTLTELMVSLVMFGIVSAIILGMVRGQQRFYRGATEVIDVRSQLRQAAALLPLELRSVSTVSTASPAGSKYQPSVLGSDITAMSDSSIQFHTTIGSGVVCAVSGGNTLTFVPNGVLARGNTLTSWYQIPARKDTVFIFDPGPLSGAGDDQWRPYRISTTISADITTWPKDACGGTGAAFVTAGGAPAGDGDKRNLQFTLENLDNSSVALPSSIGVGSVVRFTRTVRYGLYLSGADWYLGYKSVPAGGGSLGGGYEPVSGPYRAYVGGGATNGLALTYYDSSGVQVANMSQYDKVARVDIVLRGAGKEQRNGASWSSQKNNTVFKDSLLLRVAIRNRS